MLFTSLPDSAVFEVHGHTLATALKTDCRGNVILPFTGERISDVMKRVDSATFFRDGEKVAVAA